MKTESDGLEVARVIPAGMVCSECIDEPALRDVIAISDGEPGCSFCKQFDAPTIDIDELGQYMRERLMMFFSFSIEHLMYVSADGGYQGTTWTTCEVLEEQVGLEFPRQEDSELIDALADAIEPDEPWCEYDPGGLEQDESMLMDWEHFCDVIKYRRRFFFHDVGGPKSIVDDDLAPGALLKRIATFIDELELIVTWQAGRILYRARERKDAATHYTAPRDLGPAPADIALQSNRMNPPGIPMFYGAEDPRIAFAEIRSDFASVATFAAERALRILDLAALPPTPSIFEAEINRQEVKVLRFLHAFTRLITQSVERGERTVLDYLPTQVFSEFLRDYVFKEGAIDGMRYPSAIANDGPASAANVVLFADSNAVFDALPEHDDEGPGFANLADHRLRPWLRLRGVTQFPDEPLPTVQAEVPRMTAGDFGPLFAEVQHPC